MHLSAILDSLLWVYVIPILVLIDLSKAGNGGDNAVTEMATVNKEPTDNTYCGYVLFSWKSSNFPKRVNISVGQILDPPLYQSIYDKFINGSSVIMVDQPDEKICKIVVCGFTLRGGYPTDYGDCSDFWETRTAGDSPYAYGFEMSSVRCGCGTGIRNCGEQTCETKELNLDESPRMMCAVLYEEYNCQECYFKGTPMYHNEVYDTLHSKEVLSLYVRPGCNLVRTMGPPLNYNYPKYDLRHNSSLSKQDLTFSRISDVYKCECYKLIKKLSSTTPNTPKLTTRQSTTTTPTTTDVPTTTQNTSTSTHYETETPDNPSDLIISGDASDNRTNYIIIGTGVFAGVSVCVICIILWMIHERRKLSNSELESNSLETFKRTGVDGYIKDFIEGSVIKSENPVCEIISQEQEQSKEESDNELRNKSYCVALALPYDSKYEIQRNHFHFDPADADCKIGYGAFGLVYKGTLLTFDDRRFRDIAIKTVQGISDSSGKQFLKSLLNEIKVLSYIGYHENIVYFIGACTVNLKKYEVFLIMDYCANGSLLKYLENMPTEIEITSSRNESKGPFLGKAGYMMDDGSADEVKTEKLSQEFYNMMVQWCMQIASGMEFLCSRNVLHIDLAARNVLLTEDLTARISDFGLSRKLYPAVDYKKNQQDVLIPIPWMALETVTERRSDKRYSKMSDVWAYGVTIWEVFSKGKEPYEGMDFQDIFCMLNRGERLSQPQFAPDDVYDKMLNCWAQNPQERPSFTDLKDFFQRILKNYEREIKYDL